MTSVPEWWRQPRRITIVVDNPSWILPFAEHLVAELQAGGDEATLARDHAAIPQGVAAFYLGCIRLTPPEILARNRFNLVVHESDLPRGRGFSPLTWQILEGCRDIPICLLEAVDGVDAGPVYLRDTLHFSGHELIGELRESQGSKTVELCRRFLAAPSPPTAIKQQGEPSHYARRRPVDSRMDPEKSLAEQFNLLRVVDNEKYPAWFEYNGHRYRLAIEKME